MEVEISKTTQCGTVPRILNNKISTSSLASSSVTVTVTVAAATSMVKI